MHCTHLVQSLYVVYLLLSVKENEKYIFSSSEKPGCQVEQTRSSTRSVQCQVINTSPIIFQVFLVLSNSIKY